MVGRFGNGAHSRNGRWSHASNASRTKHSPMPIPRAMDRAIQQTATHAKDCLSLNQLQIPGRHRTCFPGTTVEYQELLSSNMEGWKLLISNENCTEAQKRACLAACAALSKKFRWNAKRTGRVPRAKMRCLDFLTHGTSLQTSIYIV